MSKRLNLFLLQTHRQPAAEWLYIHDLSNFCSTIVETAPQLFPRQHATAWTKIKHRKINILELLIDAGSQNWSVDKHKLCCIREVTDVGTLETWVAPTIQTWLVLVPPEPLEVLKSTGLLWVNLHTGLLLLLECRAKRLDFICVERSREGERPSNLGEDQTDASCWYQTENLCVNLYLWAQRDSQFSGQGSVPV